MEVLKFFENLFNNFGQLVSFLDTKVTLPNLMTGGIVFPNTEHGLIWESSQMITLSLWQILSVSVGAGLAFLLALHLFHLVKPIG